ncbi:hypothetical protein IRJ41_006548 [Triplophysa rosa]|uniref:Uncharacterized protein n=1 Tax=Triplophysa rosa TaxID=992332 RepID=A0A9W7WU18_TRIRA|nr:hypothetical protein IRJ41_006548 [Triplophysa rosa]
MVQDIANRKVAKLFSSSAFVQIVTVADGAVKVLPCTEGEVKRLHESVQAIRKTIPNCASQDHLFRLRVWECYEFLDYGNASRLRMDQFKVTEWLPALLLCANIVHLNSLRKAVGSLLGQRPRFFEEEREDGDKRRPFNNAL